MSFPASIFDNEVQYQVRDDGVAVITLNAPHRLNTMSRKMANGVQHALDLASEDSAVRAVVLTASGTRAFCVGGNLASDDDGAATGFRGRPGDAVPPTTAAAIRTLRTAMCSSLSLREMRVPTLAAINGACAGAGLSWACACDLRFCADTALFRTAFLTAGLSGDYGLSWTLPRIVGPASARELMLLNPKLSAAQALRLGLVTRVLPQAELLPRVLEAAAELALAPPLALARIKQNLLLADGPLSFSDALDSEAENHARTALHPDAREAGTAFLQKRRPQFVGTPPLEAWRHSKL